MASIRTVMNVKVPTLLRLSFICGLVSLSVIIACEKKQDKAAADSEEPYFHKGVGAPIDSATANRYRRNLGAYVSKHRSAAATTTTYYLPAVVLANLIQADNAIGILFYYGQDSLGNVHLVPIGIDKRDFVMAAPTIVTTAGPVSWSVAKQWRATFKQQHPDGSTPWGYFWGSDAVRRLLDQGTELVHIELGIKDDNSQTLMFSNAADPTPTSQEDNVRVCPPYCGREDEIIN